MKSWLLGLWLLQRRWCRLQDVVPAGPVLDDFLSAVNNDKMSAKMEWYAAARHQPVWKDENSRSLGILM